MPASWPTESDITAALSGLGIDTIPTGMSVADLIEEAIEAFEAYIGRSPFKKDAIDVTVTMSPRQSSVVTFDQAFDSITSVTFMGTVLEEGSEYWLEPADGPYHTMTCSFVLAGEPNSLVIVGKRGQVIPYQVFRSIVDYVSGMVYERAGQAGTVLDGVTEINQDSVKIKMAGAGSQPISISESLKASAQKVWSSYRQVGFGRRV